MNDPVNVWGMAFHRPWGEAIVRPVPQGATAPGPKRIDNRGRPLVWYIDAGSMHGAWVAVYAAAKVDRAGLEWMARTYGYAWTEADLAPKATLLGAVQFDGFVAGGDHPWYFGAEHNGRRNYGWRIARVVAFPEPVPHKPACAQGVWRIQGADGARVAELIRAGM